MTTYSDVFAGYEAKRGQMRRFLIQQYIGAFNLDTGTLLDAGCGNGFWGALFADAGFKVRGIDVDRSLIEEGKEKYPDVKLSVGDVDKGLSSLGKFDVVFARCLPHFYGPDLSVATELVKNLVGRLKPGGLLLISIYSNGSGEDRPNDVGGVARHYADVDLMNAVRAAGSGIARTVRAGNYLQIGVRG